MLWKLSSLFIVALLHPRVKSPSGKNFDGGSKMATHWWILKGGQKNGDDSDTNMYKSMSIHGNDEASKIFKRKFT